MPLITFGLPALVATILLVAHAWHTRGRRFALELFGLGFGYFVVKENLSARGYFHVYTFPEAPPLAIGLAPVGVVVGWLFAAYLSWTLAERLLARHAGLRGLLFPTLAVAMLVTTTIAYPIEAVGTSLGWWEWTVDGRPWVEVLAEQPRQPLVAIPAVPLVGWPIFVGAFLFLVMGLERALGARWQLKLPLFALGAALHFEAVHGIGIQRYMPFAIEALAFGTAVVFLRVSAPSAPRAATHALARLAPEIAVAAMAIVVTGFSLVAARDATLLLSLVPLGMFLVASEPATPRRLLPMALGVLAVLGVLMGSQQVFTLALFPLAFLVYVGLRSVTGAWRTAG